MEATFIIHELIAFCGPIRPSTLQEEARGTTWPMHRPGAGQRPFFLITGFQTSIDTRVLSEEKRGIEMPASTIALSRY